MSMFEEAEAPKDDFGWTGVPDNAKYINMSFWLASDKQYAAMLYRQAPEIIEWYYHLRRLKNDIQSVLNHPERRTLDALFDKLSDTRGVIKLLNTPPKSRRQNIHDIATAAIELLEEAQATMRESLQIRKFFFNFAVRRETADDAINYFKNSKGRKPRKEAADGRGKA